MLLLLGLLWGLVAPVEAWLEMPQWLQDLSGLDQWPENGNLPYIPMANIDLDIVAKVTQRIKGQCSPSTFGPSDCASDCGYYCGEDVSSCPTLSQSFDDGPSNATLVLLDALKTVRMKTTFFVLGERVVERSEIFRRQVREGHLMGTHSWDHPYLPSLSNEQVAAQLQWSIWVMNASAGVVPRFFRPPYGGIDARIRAIAKQFGLMIVLWDHDSEDWRLNDGTMTHERVLDQVKSWKPKEQSRSWWQRLWPPFSSRERTIRGLILEHDLSYKTVYAALAIASQIGTHQNTVAECASWKEGWYQNRFV